MKLVVTIPALNEEKTIGDVVRGVPRDIPGISETEVIVINDGSTDRTAELATQAGAAVVNLKGGGGLGMVFKTGQERAMRRGADIIVNIDGDGQFNPADIRTLIEPLLRDEADFVTCTRFADPNLIPEMPAAKFYGNRMVTRIINWVCGGTKFTDVSCGFRAFSREAAYRLTLFGRFTYTQECFIDLVAKGVRMAEVPLRVRGVREHGKSRMASSVLKYGYNSLPIILRAMRDIQPLKFFGGIATFLFIAGLLMFGFVGGWYMFATTHEKVPAVVPPAHVEVAERPTPRTARQPETNGGWWDKLIAAHEKTAAVAPVHVEMVDRNAPRTPRPPETDRGEVVIHKTSPFTSFIPIAGVLVVLAFLMGALALLADMLGRHRRISEELLYLARRRIYSNRRTIRAALPDMRTGEAGEMAADRDGLQSPGSPQPALSLHDSWSLPVVRSVPPLAISRTGN